MRKSWCTSRRFQVRPGLQGRLMCQAVFVEVPETLMQSPSWEPWPVVHPSRFILQGQVMYWDFSHSPGPEMLWHMETFSGLGLLFSEILILNSQPQGSCQGPGGFCSEVQLWDRKSDQLWPPWGSATNHGFEQHRSVPSDVHFCEQFASLLGGRLLKCVFF